MTYHVTAPLVSVTNGGKRVFHLFKGDVVPADISKDSLKNLISLGFVTEDEVAPAGDGDLEPLRPEIPVVPEPLKRGPGRPPKNPTA